MAAVYLMLCEKKYLSHVNFAKKFTVHASYHVTHK